MTRSQEATVVRFDAAVERIGNRRIVRLPADASAQLPSRGQVAADVTVDGATTRIVVEPDGLRGHWLDADILRAPGGDESLAIVLAPRPARDWPEPTTPHDLDAALMADDRASATWETITPMARWEWVRWVQATRNPGTRAHRVEVSVDKLANGSRRPCCFDLSSCTDPELARSGRLPTVD